MWVFGCKRSVLMQPRMRRREGVMCRGECSGLCSVCSLGALLQLGASGSFYFVGQCKGHVYKPWTRDTDRKWIAYHVVSDIGNALWIIGSAYDPSSPVPLAFNEYGSQGFPLCWWPWLQSIQNFLFSSFRCCSSNNLLFFSKAWK